MVLLGVFCAVLLAYGLLSRVLQARSLTPQIVLLVSGIAVGLAIRGSSEVTVDTEVLHVAGEFALVLALTVDAARIDVAALRGTAGLPIRLLAIGLPLTIAAGILAALAILPGVTVLDALILATLVAPTDAALGAVVVSSERVPLRIRQALNVESGLNDGLVTPIVLVAAAAAQAGSEAAAGAWVADAIAQIGLGVIAGALVGIGTAVLLRVAIHRGWILEGARWMAAPAMALLAWFVAHEIGGNVFVAAFVAGLAATAAYGRVPDAFLEFAEVTGELLGLVVFFLFGALVPSIAGIDGPVILFALVALTLARMLPVAVSLIGTHLAPQTVAFMGWFGPRGLASLVLALVAIGDGSAAPPGFAPVVVAAVTATIVLSVLAHGLSAGPAVARYGRFVDTLPVDAAEREHAAPLPTRGGVNRNA